MIRVGCCGFPNGMKKYFQNFKLVEVQSSFYNLPQLKTAQKWRREAPKDFIFCLKAFQAITHPITSPTWRKSRIKNLGNLANKVGFLKPTNEAFDFWHQTLEVCNVLNSPICLIQLPASFREISENVKNSEKFFSKIKRPFQFNPNIHSVSHSVTHRNDTDSLMNRGLAHLLQILFKSSLIYGM